MAAILPPGMATIFNLEDPIGPEVRVVSNAERSCSSFSHPPRFFSKCHKNEGKDYQAFLDVFPQLSPTQVNETLSFSNKN